MAISDLSVYVIGHPEGHTTVRTTSIQSWLDTLAPGHGYTQTPAAIQWKAQRSIAAAYDAAASTTGEARPLADVMVAALDNLGRDDLRRVALAALLLADGPDSPWADDN